MIEELTRLHRSTALHIQRQLSARPRAGNFVAHPLNFLHESPFLPYKGGEIDNRIKNEVLDQASKASRGELLTYGEPLAILSESGSGKSILVARVAQRLMEAIHENPEADVLVLFAQLKHAQGTDLLQEICSSVGLGRFSNLEELRLYLPEELRTHRLILLIDSLDESQHRKDWHRLDRELRQPLAAPASDGLNDVLPVWVSRRHDWQGFSPDPYKALQGLLKSESLSLNINGNQALGKALHSLFKQRQNEMEQRYGEQWREKSSFHKSYLRWALEHYQILHLPRTVHLESNRSEEFFLRVCNAALDHLDSLIQSHRGVKWEHNNPQTWAKDLDLISTARTNLAFAVLSASIDEAIHRVPEIHQGDARKAVNDFLSDYSHDALNALTKNRGELSDTLSRHLSIKNVHLLSALSDLGLVLRSDHDALHYRWAHRDLTMMGMLTPSLMQETSEAFKEILDSAQEEGWELVLTNAPLVLTGDSRRGSTSNQQFHRKSGHSLSFAEPMFTKDLYALIYNANSLDSPLHVLGTPWDGIEPYEKRTDGIKLFLEWARRQRTAKSEGYDGPGVNTLAVLNSISSPKMQSLFNKALANHSHDFQGKAKATTAWSHQIIRHILPNRLRFTEEQQDIIDKTNSSLPFIFKGPPGTGKTWLGTEILLGHANKWNAQAWIITLNSHLADEIRDNIPEHHKNGPLHQMIHRGIQWGSSRDNTDWRKKSFAAFQELIERRVQVFDIEHIMEALARALGFDSPRILTDAVLQRIFLKEIIGQRAVMKNIPNASSALLWSRALRDFKNGMFDDLNGGMRSGNEYIAFTKKRIRSTHDSLLSHGEEIMRSWHRCIKKAIDDGYLPPQEISGKLFLEMQGPAGFGYLDTVAQRIENDLGTPLPESILLDELQDLSVGEVVSLLLLTRIGSDEANRIILVGDQFQSLNGNRFTWDTWLNDFGSLVRRLREAIHGRPPSEHVLHALANVDESAGHELSINQRSNPEIVDLVRSAWAWPGDESHLGNKAALVLQPGTEKTANSRTLVHYVPKERENALLEYVLEVLKDATQYIDLSVLVVDLGVADALRRMLDLKTDLDPRVRMTTIYDPAMIKGLERDAVLVIAPFLVSNKGELPLLSERREKGVPLTAERKAQLHRLNQHVHVALSRAKEVSTILCLEPPIHDSGHEGGATSRDVRDARSSLRLRQYANPIEAWRISGSNDRTAETIDQATANLSLYSDEELDLLRPFIRLNEIAQENRRAKVDAGLEGQMERVRDAFIDEFGALDSAHPFCAGLLHLVHQENIAVGASSIIHSLIGKSGSTTTKDAYGRAHRRAKHPDGQKLTPDELHATVEYWYEAMRHQKAILRLKFGHNSIEEHLQEGIQDKVVAKLRTHRDELLERALDVIRDDIKVLYPDYLKRFIAMGERSDSEALTPDMLLAHLLNRAKSVDFGALSSAGADGDALKPHWTSTLALVLREHDRNHPSAMSFLRGLSGPSAKAWVASEPTVEAYLQHIMMGKMIQENDSLEPVIAAATNLRKWKYQHADAPPLPRWFTRSFAALLNVSDSPKRSNYPDQSLNLLRYFDAGTYHHNGHHHRNNADTLRAIGESFLTGSDVTPQTIPHGLVLFAQLWKRAIPSSAGDDDPAVVNAFVEAGSAWYRTFTRLLGKVLDSMSTPYFAHRPIEWHLYTYLPAIMKTDMPLVLDWAKNHEPSVQAMHSNDAELLAVLIPILKQHNEYRRSGKGSAVIGHRDSNRMKLFDDIESSFPTPNSKPGAPENRGATASPILNLLSPHLRKLIKIKLSEEKPPKRIDVQEKNLRATDLLPRRGLYGLPTAVALPTGRVMSDWLESGRPANDSAGETLTAWMTTSRLLLPPETMEGHAPDFRFQWHEVEHPSDQINTNGDLFRFLYSEPSHVREFIHTDHEGLSQKRLLLVVNPLDRIGAFAEEHLRGLPFEYVEVSDIVLHRALTSQMGLKPGAPFYNQIKSVALDTLGAESPPSAIDPDAISVRKPENGQSAPEVRVSLVYGPSINLFHDLLAERLASKDALAVKLWGTSKPIRKDLNNERKEIWDLRGWFTKSQQDDWTEYRLWAARERGSRSSADPLLAWANDLGVRYSNESRVRAWKYFPSLEFTWE